jgi:sugar phosphate isomerase/epimerase
MLKLSVFTVMLPDLTPNEAATAMRDYGYEGIEWRVKHIPPAQRSDPPSFWGNNLCTFDMTSTEATRAKAVAVEAGLELVNLGTYIDVGDLGTVEAAMQFAQTCGSPQIRVSPGSLDAGMSYEACFERARTFLSGTQDLGRQYNIKSLVEIHHKTITPSASLAHRLVSSFDPDFIGVIHDAGNMIHEGFENYRLGLELLGPYLAHVHIKNARYDRPAEGGVWQGQWSPLEDGIVNWDDLFTALKSIGYIGWLGLENFSQVRSSRATLEHDATFFREQIARIYG